MRACMCLRACVGLCEPVCVKAFGRQVKAATQRLPRDASPKPERTGGRGPARGCGARRVRRLGRMAAGVAPPRGVDFSAGPAAARLPWQTRAAAWVDDGSSYEEPFARRTRAAHHVGHARFAVGGRLARAWVGVSGDGQVAEGGDARRYRVISRSARLGQGLRGLRDRPHRPNPDSQEEQAARVAKPASTRRAGLGGGLRRGEFGEPCRQEGHSGACRPMAADLSRQPPRGRRRGHRGHRGLEGPRGAPWGARAVGRRRAAPASRRLPWGWSGGGPNYRLPLREHGVLEGPLSHRRGSLTAVITNRTIA